MATNVSVFWFSILISSKSYLLVSGSDLPKVLKRFSYLANHEEQFSMSLSSVLKLARS